MSGAERRDIERRDQVGLARLGNEPRRTEEVTAMTKEPKRTLGRREFLRTIGAGATIAAAAAAPLAGEARADTENNDEKRRSRYRESAEVKTFYRVNRYPS
jgi:hypothetical protein